MLPGGAHARAYFVQHLDPQRRSPGFAAAESQGNLAVDLLRRGAPTLPIDLYREIGMPKYLELAEELLASS